MAAVQTVEYTVKKGDTLTAIAKKHGTTPDDLAKLNDIENKDLIYVGQVLVISGKKVAKKTTTEKLKKTVTIDAFGLQSNTDSTLFATWKWSKNNTKEYRVKWEYYTNGLWFTGSDSTVTEKESTYSVPSNIVNGGKARVKVQPISTTRVVNKKETNYWTAGWSTAKTYTFAKVITTPSVPTVSIANGQLTARLDNLDGTGTNVEFQVVLNDSSIHATLSSSILRGVATVSCKISDNNKYKVRCRAYITAKGVKTYSGWSNYSDNKSSKPSKSTITKCEVRDKNSIYLEWKTINTAKTYTLEYTDNKTHFDVAEVSRKDNITLNKYLLLLDESGIGKEYFFRVKAVNDENVESAWSDVINIKIGTPPGVPTTWSSTSTAVVGEKLTLYWVHNSEDGSRQTKAQITLYINGEPQPVIELTYSKDDEETMSYYDIDTSPYIEGTTIDWTVKTAGVTGVYGKDSTRRTIDVYAKPTLNLGITDASGTLIDTIESYPFTVSTTVGPATQQPIGYHLSIVSNDIYEATDDIGNEMIVNEGQELYSEYFDIHDILTVEFLPSMVNLENNISYTLNCTVSMDSGLTADASLDFTVYWSDDIYDPNAEISIDHDTLTASIRPYCELYRTYYYKVNYNETTGKYVVTNEKVDFMEDGISVDGFSTTGEIVYYSEANDTYFTVFESEDAYLVEDVTLSVYRREFDGTFTELATGIENTSNTWIQDPHPALDYARYRIVAIDKSTGAVSYNDLPGYPVEEPSIIIQWDEKWSYFYVSDEDEQEQPPWAGSLLKLPYNIDVSDSNSKDVSHIEYIGRKHKVSYYGTQLGETATWNVDIDKEDKETLYALRRLKIWMGDAYVREPSGSGYWASVKVSFSQNHKELVIPVTLEITRVEGGI